MDQDVSRMLRVVGGSSYAFSGFAGANFTLRMLYIFEEKGVGPTTKPRRLRKSPLVISGL